jgi:hypothetical protein
VTANVPSAGNDPATTDSAATDPASTGPAPLAPAWHAFLDDAAVFAPGGASLHAAIAAHTARRADPAGDLVGCFVLRDRDLPLVRGSTAELAVVGTQGAAQLAGPLGLAARLGLRVSRLEIALRDLDDLPANARRVTAAAAAAAAEGLLADEVAVVVELPATPPTAGWLGAADEVAAAGHRLKLHIGAEQGRPAPDAHTLAEWVDAALDREAAFSCTPGLERALRHRDRETGLEHHGFLNVLLATRAALDGATVDEVAALLDDGYPNDLVALARTSDLAGARRWFTSFASCAVHRALDDLLALGLLEAPG